MSLATSNPLSWLAGEPIGSASTNNGALGVCALACLENPNCTSFIYCNMGPVDPCQVPTASGQRRSIAGGSCDLLSQAGLTDTTGLMALSGPVVGELTAGGWACGRVGRWAQGETNEMGACILRAGKRQSREETECDRGGMAASAALPDLLSLPAMPHVAVPALHPAGSPVRSQAASLAGYASLRGIVPPFDLGVWNPEYIADAEM